MNASKKEQGYEEDKRVERITKESLNKLIGIADLNLFDVPLLDTFKNKKFAIYTLKTLLGIVVDNPDDLDIQTESYIQNL